MNAVESRAVVLKLVSRDYRTSVRASSRELNSAEKVEGASENGIFTPPEIPAATTANSVTIPQQVVLRECIKVSYRIGSLVEVVTGTEARIPVQWHELQLVSATVPVFLYRVHIITCYFFYDIIMHFLYDVILL